MSPENNNTSLQSDPMFMSLILSLEASSMQALGKIINPITQKTEKNLQQAQMTIDMIGMLEKKTAGNLSKDEEELLKRVLYQLRMNYLDELNREKQEKTGESDEKPASSSDIDSEQAELKSADDDKKEES